MARPSRARTMARTAASALLAAVEIYNKPTFPYREQTCALLMVNAWEILLKARIIQQEKRLQAIYQREPGSRLYRRDSVTGEPTTISIRLALARTSLPAPVRANIEGLIVIRNRAMHLGVLGAEVQREVLYYGTASVQNFIRLSAAWFGEQVKSPYLMPLGFVGDIHLATGSLTGGQRKLLQVLRDIVSTAEPTKAGYAVRIHAEVALNPRLTGGGSIGVTRDPSAPEVRLRDDVVLERYHARYRDVVSSCRERYPGFKQNARFHKAMAAINDDPACTHERRLDPSVQSSAKQRFYDLDAVLTTLDAEYQEVS